MNILVIAGLDPSGGAGLLADTRVVAHHDLRPVGVVTGLTEQDTTGVRNANVVAVEIVEAQLRALMSDIEIAAVKIGMLGSDKLAAAIADALSLTNAPVVWDPVLLPTRGRVPLFQGSPSRAMQLLAPHVTVVTPNLQESAAMAGLDAIEDVDAMAHAATAMRAAGMDAVLVTGGHLDGAATDVLAHARGTELLDGERIDTGGPVHGTGCALSTALACRLALGDDLQQAARAAKQFVADRLRAPVHPGRGLAAIL